MLPKRTTRGTRQSNVHDTEIRATQPASSAAAAAAAADDDDDFASTATATFVKSIHH